MWWAIIKSSALLLFLLCSCTRQPESRPPILYLASSLLPLKSAIETNLKKNVSMKFLNSSAIAQQIEQGFPCDVVIVADNKWQNFLIERNLVDSHSKIFARNNLILAKNNSQTIFLTLEKLISKHEKIIVADPDYVPLGSYTKSALVTLGLFKQLEKNFIKAHSAQVARLLLKEGAANFAFLYASDVDNKNIFQATFIDAKLHPPIIYPLLQCKKSQKNHAHLLNSFLMSDEMQKILKNNGFGAAREQ